ncbi:putative pilin [Nautilia profundicola AmH]|uniref:Pilin n=1 Tax=Nautilia profundicola (strain ATCC BAA-1463 / DSM 18972 / AmH) TaxID=598659 RepID=B9L5X2_NAUPA|nr:prepilin-type N-terminal cleavage/methylation domain-containing protein [Nautilia profundicola]ACM93436.1 putative pilin [Nautilia profundicola AmH]
MKKAFTLIELIFVIVIIGVLASIAIPKFKNLTTHAKSSGIKSVVTSVQSSIDNIHGKWIINDNYIWDPDGDGNTNLNDEGYPISLDSGKNETSLFKYVLKIPVPSCGNRTQSCWKEYDDNRYEYIYTPSKILKIDYNATTGTLECTDGVGITKEECEQTIY